jgi:hypothetical protein
MKLILKIKDNISNKEFELSGKLPEIYAVYELISQIEEKLNHIPGIEVKSIIEETK